MVKRDTIKIYEIERPESILDLGLRHPEQISLLEKIQNALLAEQAVLLNLGYARCPNCGEKIKKNGYTQSQFHAVFSYHTLRVQKHRCSNPDCDWQNFPTITSAFGTNIHQDLAKLQCEQGALYSYREAQSNLDKLNYHHRSVNNHNQIKQITNKVGVQLDEAKRNLPSTLEGADPATELIIQVDGGHIPIQDKEKHSFEALSAVIYRPENIQQLDLHHRQIVDKACVASAIDDQLQTIKTYLMNAALKQGMSASSKVTALADGANNCWSVLAVVQPHCDRLECILDWFHIGKRFQTVKNALGEAFEQSLDSAKWKLWHGEADEALMKLTSIRDNLTDAAKRSKLKGLHDYLQRNRAYLVNYDERDKANKTYTHILHLKI